MPFIPPVCLAMWLAGATRDASDRYRVEVTVAPDYEGDKGEGDAADSSGDLPATLGGEYHA